MKLFSRERPPASLTSVLDRTERITTWADLSTGLAAVSTLGLWLPSDSSYERVPWHLIDKAVWNSPVLSLTTAAEEGTLASAAVIVEQPPRTLRVSVARHLPDHVRQRVTRSVRHTEHHALSPTGGVRIVARRVAGQDGLAWHLRFDPGTDADDPLLREQTARYLAAAQALVAPAPSL